MNKLISALRRILKRKHNRYRIRKVQILPEKLHSKTVYLQTHLDVPWQAAMECPCGCKEIVHLNLIPTFRPNWRYRMDKARITLIPSVRRTTGCKSHYFLRQGKIEWCKY